MGFHLSVERFVFFLFVFLSCCSAYTEQENSRYIHEGVGVSIFVGPDSEEFLVQKLIEEQDLFGPYLELSEAVQRAPDQISEATCKYLLWIPRSGRRKWYDNRLECKVSFADFSDLRIWLSLKDEMIGNDVFENRFPDIYMEGPVTRLIFSLLKKHSLDERVTSFPFPDARDNFVLGQGQRDSRPLLFCQQKKGIRCELMFPLLSQNKEELDLGEAAPFLIDVFCSTHAHQVRGECPRQNTETRYHRCEYVGAWSPYGTWGSLSHETSIRCRYLEGLKQKEVEIQLGSVRVRPWGNRFSDPGVTLMGQGLEELFYLLKKFALANPKQSTVEHTVLGGRPPWGSQWVTVERFLDPDEKIASLSCYEENVSMDSFQQVPVPDGGVLGYSYTCTLRKHFVRLRR